MDACVTEAHLMIHRFTSDRPVLTEFFFFYPSQNLQMAGKGVEDVERPESGDVVRGGHLTAALRRSPKILRAQKPRCPKLSASRSTSHTMLAPSRGRALARAIDSSSASFLPSFLLPAFQLPPARQFSASTSRPSKLGRIPISIPPGVELLIGEPKVKVDATTYLKIPKRTVTVQGPLGASQSPRRMRD